MKTAESIKKLQSCSVRTSSIVLLHVSRHRPKFAYIIARSEARLSFKSRGQLFASRSIYYLSGSDLMARPLASTKNRNQ
ncbi:predicted protein [Sclerotinia sclerotiorum 1980 UF-70]|uniref:Uncharacterized protein n=1 Tax=Sclerotinia sclerotiorum (strain ATCC 18683 / 1980 / Ss-1) TaxID=665079 RepID=A7E9F3_SCLS1|nr:predicted protein [Sclerotinia sclerotiorum 1980 UF-70]EDN97005.1 predicted protein [Sclerotinia sclerotiorum 1980 UF-70]